MDSLIPYPFRAVQMHDGVPHGAETRAKILRELFIGEAVQAPSRRRSAQALYSNRNRSSSGVNIENPPASILNHPLRLCVLFAFAASAAA